MKEARLDSYEWWLRVNWVLRLYEETQLVKLRERALDCTLARLANAEGPGRVELVKRVNGQLQELIHSYMPWLPKVDATMADALTEQWVKQWGDPKDPAVQDRILRTVAALNEENLLITKKAS